MMIEHQSCSIAGQESKISKLFGFVSIYSFGWTWLTAKIPERQQNGEANRLFTYL
jgi:hypothetical protein